MNEKMTMMPSSSYARRKVHHHRRCFTACDTCRAPRASGDRKHHPHRKIIASDPYVKVLLAGATVACTRVIPNSQRPKWEQEFHIPVAHPVSHVEFQVKDNDLFGAQIMGTVQVPASRFLSGELIDEWFPVIGSSGKPPKPDSALHLEMRYTPVEKNPLFQHGIAADPEHRGVRHTYFPWISLQARASKLEFIGASILGGVASHGKIRTGTTADAAARLAAATARS